MLVLGVDCSSKQGSVALTKDGRPLYQCVYDSNMTHSQNLLSLVDNAVSVCGIKKEDIDLFAVTLGPGSFTGIRIGVSSARALAQVMGLPTIAVPTLKAFAYNMPDFNGLICPV
ncbi:MAG: tRNA (adenosine(37)-N6)-threonylcarbamoyltransferase complex dimerization subunit type 1 TsaB, partial [Oscillospiraceae bacterium]|nr:tRNA (adenosine(37)-N6)-threonylcarbamoyltransferase complex dimerization subunit type 1 TsaB [Oscillospiraceae bacterium]